MSNYRETLRAELWNKDWPAGTAVTLQGLDSEAVTLGAARLEDGVAVVDVDLPGARITVPLDRCRPVYPNAVNKKDREQAAV